MDFRNIPVSPASEAPPEVVNAFLKFVQQNPGMFMGKQVDLNQLMPAPQHMHFRCPQCDATVLSGMEECPQCKASTRQTLKAGDILQERYQVEGLMMRTGGFGNLYGVHDLADGKRPLAMKQLQHGRQLREKDRQLFEREGKLLKALHHRSLPRFHDYFTLHGAQYLVMERIEGITLGHFMRAKGAFSEEQTIALLPQMLEVLSYLHHLPTPVIHRDIKPGNFMVTQDGHLYLIDFGGATDLDPQPVEFGPTGIPEDLTGVFTKGFSAPEIFLGAAPKPASDLFSLGGTLMFMLTSQHPFTHYDPMTAGYRVDELPASDGLKRVIRKLTAISLSERYGDAEDVLQDLLAAGYIRPNA